MKEVVLIRGLPGSGKTTIAKSMMDDAVRSYAHVEADDYFMGQDGAYRYDGSKITNAHDACYFSAAKALQDGKSVIVANTFSRLWEMERYYRLAASFGCNVRVLTATGRYQNVHGVPVEIIQRMRDRWES